MLTPLISYLTLRPALLVLEMKILEGFTTSLEVASLLHAIISLSYHVPVSMSLFLFLVVLHHRLILWIWCGVRCIFFCGHCQQHIDYSSKWHENC